MRLRLLPNTIYDNCRDIRLSISAIKNGPLAQSLVKEGFGRPKRICPFAIAWPSARLFASVSKCICCMLN
ncbi:Uncharacterised protein [uncultured archaeon]|nr:Uncharacterised protein [uncultured archaeon]